MRDGRQDDARSALAASSGIGLIATSYTDWQSAGEAHMGTLIKRMRQVFDVVGRNGPVIVFIDEIDAIPKRGSQSSGRHDDWWTAIVTALLQCVDGNFPTEEVIVLAACNHGDNLDAALIRSGRIERRFDIGLPDEEALKQIISHHLPGRLAAHEIRMWLRFAVSKSSRQANTFPVARAVSSKALRRQQKRVCNTVIGFADGPLTRAYRPRRF